jgi:hypothetical protein
MPDGAECQTAPAARRRERRNLRSGERRQRANEPGRLDVLDALDPAQRAADGTNDLLDRFPRRLRPVVRSERPCRQSVRTAVQASVVAQAASEIVRSKSLVENRTGNPAPAPRKFAPGEIAPTDYWLLHSLLVVIVKRLSS